MAALTDHMREVAFEMFGNDETTERVARRIRQSVESTRALRANWTRNLPPVKKSRSTSR